MNYIALDDLKNAWIFRHKSLPITDADKEKIKPMSPTRARQLWDTYISKQVDHPDFFTKGDWPFKDEHWLAEGRWEEQWDSENEALPELILDHLTWDENTVVYFCVSNDKVFETTWAVFKRCWKNFLFMDDGSLLVAKKRNEAAQFFSDGRFKTGLQKLI